MKRSADEIELEKLRRRNKALEDELDATKTALEITGKAHLKAVADLNARLQAWRSTQSGS